MAGNDLRTMTEETKSILMNPDAIALDQDRNPKPVERRAPDGKSEVLVRQLTGNAVAVGLFNRGDRAAEIGFRRDSLPFEARLLGWRRPPAGLAPLAGAGSVEARSRAGYRWPLFGDGPAACRGAARIARRRARVLIR